MSKINILWHFLTDSLKEIKNITWLKKEYILPYTLKVIFLCIVISILVFLIDYASSKIILFFMTLQ